DDFGLDVIDFGDVALDVLDKIKPRVVRVHVQRGGDALHGVQRITKDTITLGVTLNLIEQNRFALFATMMAKFGDGANLHVPVGAVDARQFSELLNLVDPSAQVPAFRGGDYAFFANSCLGLHDDLDPRSNM